MKLLETYQYVNHCYLECTYQGTDFSIDTEVQDYWELREIPENIQGFREGNSGYYTRVPKGFE